MEELRRYPYRTQKKYSSHRLHVRLKPLQSRSERKTGPDAVSFHKRNPLQTMPRDSVRKIWLSITRVLSRHSWSENVLGIWSHSL